MRAEVQLERVIAWLYLLAAVGFSIGSVLFLPRYDGSSLRDLAVWLFIAGSVVILLIACADMAEALSVGHHLEEVVIQLMYIVGCVFFTVGSVFYFPNIAARVGEPGFEVGGWLFTIGSLLFVLACFVNGIYTVHGYNASAGGGLAVVCTLVQTNAAMLGSCGFLVGSFLFVPEVDNGCPPQTLRIASWLFFAASLLFVLSGLVVIFGPRARHAVAASGPDDTEALKGRTPKARRASEAELTSVADGPL